MAANVVTAFLRFQLFSSPKVCLTQQRYGCKQRGGEIAVSAPHDWKETSAHVWTWFSFTGRSTIINHILSYICQEIIQTSVSGVPYFFKHLLSIPMHKFLACSTELVISLDENSITMYCKELAAAFANESCHCVTWCGRDTPYKRYYNSRGVTGGEFATTVPDRDCSRARWSTQDDIDQGFSNSSAGVLHSFTGAYSPGWTFGLPLRGFLITQLAYYYM
jgi:hypothetical protein